MSIEPISHNAELFERLRIQPNDTLPKGRQLYLSLYEAIASGSVRRGVTLPASRQLAKALGLGRNTVIAAYEQLIAEGLLLSHGRSGTKVIYAGAEAPSGSANAVLSQRGRNLVTDNRPRVLSPGEPDSSLFPQHAWTRAVTKAARISSQRQGYMRDAGDPMLREAIARFLAQYRGLHVSPEQVIVTASTRQSLVLAAHLYSDSGDAAWLELPCYPGASAAWNAAGLQLHPCAVDSQGMQLPEQAPAPRLVYTTPCFQYPLGWTLSVERRQALLTHVAKAEGVIFEDDYDSEFRDQSQPRPALAANNTEATVLHAGTFSKLLFPAVRVAWLVVPSTHVDAACGGLAAIGGGHSAIAQSAVAELLDNGTVSRHLARARQIYGQRRRALLAALNEDGGGLRCRTSSGGLSLVVDLPSPVDRTKLAAALIQAGIGAQPLEALCWTGDNDHLCRALVLGLGNTDSLSIPDWVATLRTVVESQVIS